MKPHADPLLPALADYNRKFGPVATQQDVGPLFAARFGGATRLSDVPDGHPNRQSVADALTQAVTTGVRVGGPHDATR